MIIFTFFRCHLGKIIKYDTITQKGWKSSVVNHGIKVIIDSLLNEDWEAGDGAVPAREVPEARNEDEGCQVNQIPSFLGDLLKYCL